MGLLVVLGAGVIVCLVAAAELGAWRISRRPPAIRRAGRCAVIVLGYPSARGGGPHPLQKWRCVVAARTLAEVDDGWLIFSGGITRGAEESEAAAMARYAVSVLAVPSDRVQREERALSTWENVANSIPLLDAGAADQVAFASDPFHAEKARRYLAVQSPEMAERLVRAADYRVLERWWLKLATGAYYLLLRARGNFGSAPPDPVP
jgi:uncharacterized SAM-binding protein YcdF (DUF218 family)